MALKSVSTPSQFADVSGDNAQLFRTSGIDPAPLEAAGRAELGKVSLGLQGLRAQTPTNRSQIGQVRTGLGNIQTRSGLLRGDVDAARNRIGGQFQTLQGQVSPGFGRLTEGRVKAVRDRRDEAVGNLRESLSRRRILGSSFASDAIDRQELAFSQEEGNVRAQSFVEELGLSRQLAVDEAVATGQLAQLSGNLLQLDQQTLGQESQTIALDMGLTQQDAQLFSQEMMAIQQASNLLAQTTQRELAELGLTADIANGVQTNIANVASNNGQLALLQAQAKAAQDAADSQNLGDILGLGSRILFGDTFGGIL